MDVSPLYQTPECEESFKTNKVGEFLSCPSIFNLLIFILINEKSFFIITDVWAEIWVDQLLFIETTNVLEFLKNPVCPENRQSCDYHSLVFWINATLIFFSTRGTFALHLGISHWLLNGSTPPRKVQALCSVCMCGHVGINT